MTQVYLSKHLIFRQMKVINKLVKLVSSVREWLFLKSMRSGFIH